MMLLPISLETYSDSPRGATNWAKSSTTATDRAAPFLPPRATAATLPRKRSISSRAGPGARGSRPGDSSDLAASRATPASAAKLEPCHLSNTCRKAWKCSPPLGKVIPWPRL